jgi:hypothetical protein
MSKKRTPEHTMDTQGVNFVKPIFENEMGCTFAVHPREIDYGTDFEIQLFESSNFTGLILKGQLKSGDSHLQSESEEDYRFSISQDDVETWLSSNSPFIFVWYSPERTQAVWLNVRRYLRQNYGGQKTFTIKIPKKNILTKQSLLDFLELARNEYSGLSATESLLLKPLYDYLYGDFNKKSDEVLEQIQSRYEADNRKLKESNISKYFQHTIDYALANRRLYSLQISSAILDNLKFQNLSSIPKKLVYQWHYYKALMSYETLDIHTALHNIETISTSFRAMTNKKVLLLNSLIKDAQGKLQEACVGYNKIIRDKKNRNNHLKGVVCLIAGVMLRRNDDYDEALKYLEQAKKYFVASDFLKGVLNSNLGALHRLRNQFADAITYYQTAITLFHNCGDRQAESEMYFLLSWTKNEEEASNGKPISSEGFELHQKAVYLRPKNDYSIPNIHLLKGYQYFVEEEFENLAGLYSSRHSNNIFNGNREFSLVQQLSDNLGAYLTTQGAQIQNALCLFNIAAQTRDLQLLQEALTYFIITDYEKGIRGVYNNGLDNISKVDIEKVLTWCISIKRDRYALLGRLDFIRVFAEVIPDKYIGKIFNICLREERLGYSFNNNFDYGRKAVTALESICNRLDKQQTRLLLKVILRKLDKNNWFVIDAKMNLLLNLDYSKLDNSDLHMILSRLNETFVEKIRTRDPWMVYHVWTEIAKECNKKEKYDIYSKLSAEFTKEVNKSIDSKVDFKYYNFGIGICLTSEIFQDLRTTLQKNQLVELLCNKLEVERKRENLKNYAIGGFSHFDGLVQLYPTVNNKLKETIQVHLMEYATAENLIPIKRMLAIKSIISLKPYHGKRDQIEIRKAMKCVLEEKECYTHDQDSLTPQEYFDYSLLKTAALKCMAVYYHPNTEWLIERAILLSLHSSKQSLPHVIQCVFEILKGAKKRQQIYRLSTILFSYLNNDTDHVTSLSLRCLADSSEKLHHSINESLATVIDELKTHHKYEVRSSVAYAAQKMKSMKLRNKKYYQNILRVLKKDVHYRVRCLANQVS